MVDVQGSVYFQQDGTSPYFGALVGRVANRIAEATFELDGEVYHVSANENTTSLHGGKVGFSKRLWKGHVFSEGEDSGVMLRYESPDGEEVIPFRVLMDMSANATYIHDACCGRCFDTKVHVSDQGPPADAPHALHACVCIRCHMHLVLCMHVSVLDTVCANLAVLSQLLSRSPLVYVTTHSSGRCPCQIKILHSLAWS